jgi:hypothetical protein
MCFQLLVDVANHAVIRMNDKRSGNQQFHNFTSIALLVSPGREQTSARLEHNNRKNVCLKNR